VHDNAVGSVLDTGKKMVTMRLFVSNVTLLATMRDASISLNKKNDATTR